MLKYVFELDQPTLAKRQTETENLCLVHKESGKRGLQQTGLKQKLLCRGQYREPTVQCLRARREMVVQAKTKGVKW